MNISEYKYKTELHAHSFPASQCSTVYPKELVKAYKNLNFDSVCLTNHFYISENENYIKEWLVDYSEAKEYGKELGINVILGMEIRFSNVNMNDYLVFGIDENGVEKAYDYVSYNLEKFYKEYKNERNVIIQAHPYRLPSEIADINFLDGIEVFNVHPKHNSRIGLSAEFAKEKNLIKICGSDFHDLGTEGLCALLTKEKVKDSFQLAEILKTKDYILEIGDSKIIVK